MLAAVDSKLTAKVMDSDGKTFTQTFKKINPEVTDAKAAKLGKDYTEASTGDALVRMQKIDTRDIDIDAE